MRVTATLLAVALLTQAVTAGLLLSTPGGRMVHSATAALVMLAGSAQLVAAVLVWRLGGGSSRFTLASALLLVTALAEGLAGAAQLTALHVPLGALLLAGAPFWPRRPGHDSDHLFHCIIGGIMALLLKSTQRRIDDAADNRRMWSVATVFTRVALSAGFLSAVADRFGLWGPTGTANVSWGGFEPYLAYVSDLAPYLPASLLGVAGWGATLAEIVLGITLLFGVALRWSAWASAATLMVFGLSMFLFVGFEAPLSASVFSACAAALLLALSPAYGYAFSLDRRRHGG